ncbi:hypothetical protein K469DRAFT_692169 [Zopfia rhizophila CBS 207.26]|uniref:Uncharacterized protein n=1 Tax=Zopfia rhizophila CBS 207.26 TaxID=1314779 RepID=A0A6A6DP90_9PEZI|nr:hypothetical protein K469DRAFT_692169 [Zopfia rhizophila CBS 207.26]
MPPSGPTKVSDYRRSMNDKDLKWNEPEEIDQWKRMQTYIALLSKKEWNSIYEVILTMDDLFDIALTINDMPEYFREKLLSRMKYHIYHTVVDYITEIQMNKGKFDPNSLFPVVATPQFLETLPKPMRRCNVCYQGFSGGKDIIQKYCGRHALHRHCLMRQMERNDLPLHGPCDCNTAGYGPSGWRKEMPL